MSIDALRKQSAHVLIPMEYRTPLTLAPLRPFSERCVALSQARWADLSALDVIRFKEILAGVGAGSKSPYVRGLLNQAIARVDKLEYQLAVSPLGIATRSLAEAARDLCETLASLAESGADIAAAGRPA